MNAPLKATLHGVIADEYGFLSGETGELFRSLSQSALPEQWPQSLKTCIHIIFTSPQPMFLWWGIDGIHIYNDACRPFLGDKHPQAMGQPGQVVWAGLWDQLQPRFHRMMQADPGAYEQPLLQIIQEDETYYNFSGSPIPGEDGGIAGVLCIGVPVQQHDASATYVKTNIADFTKGLLDQFDQLFRKTGLALVINFDTIIEEVYIDRDMWEQILLTLLANAFKYTLKGGIAVRLSQENGRVSLSVSDTGIGMSAALMSEITESLRRNTDAHKTGLSLVSELVDNHAGQLQINSRQGEGSTFSISIPLGKEHLPANKISNGSGTVVYKQYPGLMSRIESNIRISKERIRESADGQYYRQLLASLPAAVDITDQRNAEEYISRLAAIVESSDDAIISKTLDGIITSWNPAAEKLFGFTAKEMIGEPITMIIPDDKLDEEPKIIEQLKAGKKVDHFETKRIAKNGQLLDISLTISPVKNIEGTVIGASKIARDITQQRRLFLALQESESKYMQLAFKLEALVEQRTVELQEANIYLEKSNRELEQFAYITSHDLQEPLRKIHTFAGMLHNVNKDSLSDTSRKYIEKVMQSARRMSQLISELLDYSRLVHMKDPFEETDLNEILKNVITDFEVMISQHDVQLEIEELPLLFVSPLQMNQLFYNLLGNAIKFSTSGRKPVIHIYTRRLNEAEVMELPELDPGRDYCAIVVKDNGIGFDQVYADKIFQIFQRLNERSAFEGTGIGLALCSKIALNHKGTIYATGVPGEGAIFQVVLPLVQTQPA